MNHTWGAKFLLLLILLCKKEAINLNTAEPIRDSQSLIEFKEYYKEVSPMPRNYLLIVLGLNTALRISDILALTWDDVFNQTTGTYRTHIRIVEQKTGKVSKIFINQSIKEALDWYSQSIWYNKSKWIFWSRGNVDNHISRMQAHRIIKKASEYCNLEGVISCHSMRKSFGYFAWKSGISPVMLMNIYNHSSFPVTKRYLGIEQDDRDTVFKTITL